MPEHILRLDDKLKHHSYQWPQTLLTFPLNALTEEENINGIQQGGEENVTNSTPILLDEEGKAQPFQMDGENLCLLSDLPVGTTKIWKLVKGERIENYPGQKKIAFPEGEHILLTTDRLELRIASAMPKKVEEGYSLFKLTAPDEKGGTYGCEAVLETQKEPAGFSAEILKNGSLFSDCTLNLSFKDGALYTLGLRLTQGMEFADLDEKTEGFGKEEGRLTLRWFDFSPDKRFCQFRGCEKIDTYNDGELLPVKVLPYASWVSWWDAKAVSFTDTSLQRSAGVFVRKAGEWNNGQYPLWGSPEEMALTFSWNSRALAFRYPLVNGIRSTAIALFDAGRDEAARRGREASSSKSGEQTGYIDSLYFYYEFLNLNKVKDWVLRWDEDKKAYPRHFPKETLPEAGVEMWHYGIYKKPFTPAFMEDVIYRLSANMNRLWEAGPVSAREFFCWVYAFDMAAPAMTQEQFDDMKACCAFMAYAHGDENFMPVENMLAGHPNFLADARSVPALMASLFPSHPHATAWVDQFEQAMARNMKYHTRPEVKAWGSQGGRWTENLGCYNFAALVPMMKTAGLVYKTFGSNVSAYPNLKKWASYMIDSLTAPVDGRRTYPPQGAHSGAHRDPLGTVDATMLLAERLKAYDPLLSEYLMYLCPPDAPAFEERRANANIYKALHDKAFIENKGTKPPLKSVKYTGYGFVLRASVHEESEVSVHLQQIDEGPNYRWGRAGQGGCGVIYYNARGCRYSYNRPEDVGDANMGDVQACCNFGVLVGHEYRSVGRNDLTEPLLDLGFAKYAKINAGPWSQPFYRSRSVLLSGDDYIIIHDSVGDMRVRGRFSWFVKEGEPFPSIAQLKPGVEGKKVRPGPPADGIEETDDHGRRSSGRVYDGSGDFLTLVSHRSINCDYNSYTRKTDYGAEFKMQGRTDYIFKDSGHIHFSDNFSSFTGYTGLVRIYGTSKAEAAVFEGTTVGALGIVASIEPIAIKPSAEREKGESKAPKGGALSFVLNKGRLSGKVICHEASRIEFKCEKKEAVWETFTLYVDGLPLAPAAREESGFAFELQQGSYTWEWTDSLPAPLQSEILSAVVASGEVEAVWMPLAGAEAYAVEQSTDNGSTWDVITESAKENRIAVRGLKNGSKLHLRVCGVNRDHKGPWSSEYPVYVTQAVPQSPEGLKLRFLGGPEGSKRFEMTWGRLLGVKSYRLYRRPVEKDNAAGSSFELIYEGTDCVFVDVTEKDKVWEYGVSAVNANGEGSLSEVRDTAPGGLAFWDPEPDRLFKRYALSHEYGYNGYNHWDRGPGLLPDYPI